MRKAVKNQPSSSNVKSSEEEYLNAKPKEIIVRNKSNDVLFKGRITNAEFINKFGGLFEHIDKYHEDRSSIGYTVW